jgi:hypothetical protein
MRVLATGRHPARLVDPFGHLPCRHATVLVHVTGGQTLGHDLVECPRCGWVVTLADLYRGMAPPGR